MASVALVHTTLVPQPKRCFRSSGATSIGALRSVTIVCFLPTALSPVNVTFVSEREPFVESGLDRFHALLLLEQLVAFAAVLELVGEFTEQPMQRAERSFQGGLGNAFLAHSHDRPRCEEFRFDETEKLLRRFQRIDDELLRFGTAGLSKEAAFGARIEKIFQRAIDAVARKREPEVVGRDFRNRVRFV
ncbi:MAG: hypothetical protein NVV63_15350 [Opitutus sp.]|nr:hypothetical protein [Opitutus sp.]